MCLNSSIIGFSESLVRHLGKIATRLREITGNLNTRKFKKMEYVKSQIDKAFIGHTDLRSLFKIDLTGEEGSLALGWDYDPSAIEIENRLLGKYILATNLSQDQYSTDRILEMYKARHQIESRFRALKNRIRIRPIFLQSDERIKSLVLVNVLALIIYSLIEWVCKREKLATSGKNALDKVWGPIIVTLTVNGQTVRQLTDVTAIIQQISAALKIGPPEFM